MIQMPSLRQCSSIAAWPARVYRPSGRIVRRIDQHRARARRQRIEQPVDVERPAAGAERQRDSDDFGAEDLRNLGQVRPQRRDADDAVARIDQRLDRKHQRRHARGRHGDIRRRRRCGASATRTRRWLRAARESRNSACRTSRRRRARRPPHRECTPASPRRVRRTRTAGCRHRPCRHWRLRGSARRRASVRHGGLGASKSRGWTVIASAGRKRALAQRLYTVHVPRWQMSCKLLAMSGDEWQWEQRRAAEDTHQAAAIIAPSSSPGSV